jgi:ankyrin repeat protein
MAAGADANAQDHDGQTPLHYAAACGQQQVGLTANIGHVHPVSDPTFGADELLLLLQAL